MRKGEEKEETIPRNISLNTQKRTKIRVRYWKKVDRSLLKVLSIFAINSNKTKAT